MKHPQIRTEDMIKKAGGHRALADLLKVSTQAVYAWGEVIPPLRGYQLRATRPEWFKKEKAE